MPCSPAHQHHQHLLALIPLSPRTSLFHVFTPHPLQSHPEHSALQGGRGGKPISPGAWAPELVPVQVWGREPGLQDKSCSQRRAQHPQQNRQGQGSRSSAPQDCRKALCDPYTLGKAPAGTSGHSPDPPRSLRGCRAPHLLTLGQTSISSHPKINRN